MTPLKKISLHLERESEGMIKMKEFSPEQVARMTPEARARYEKRLKIVKRNRKILAVVCGTALVAIVVLVMCMTVLFNITSIKVAKTGAIYNANEIILASGLNNGDNMLRTDFEKAADRIEKNLPYVLEATVTKKLSGAVTISIKDTTAAMIMHTPDGYAIADIHGKVLEKVKELPENTKLMTIRTKGDFKAELGEKFYFADTAEQELYDEIVAHLKNAGLFEKITAIDISDKSSLKVEYQNRLRLLLGSADQLEVKLRGGVEVIAAEDSKDPNTIAEINLMIPKKVFVNSVDSLEAPTVITLPEEGASQPDTTDISDAEGTGTTSEESDDEDDGAQDVSAEENTSE